MICIISPIKKAKLSRTTITKHSVRQQALTFRSVAVTKNLQLTHICLIVYRSRCKYARNSKRQILRVLVVQLKKILGGGDGRRKMKLRVLCKEFNRRLISSNRSLRNLV